MSAWLVPIICAGIAAAGALYAARGKRATDQGDLAQRLVDQLQEERTSKEADRAKAAANERVLSDYAVRLRAQVLGANLTPEPWPELA